MASLNSLTKAQLIERITKLEDELIQSARTAERLRGELSVARANAVQRPQRSVSEHMAAAREMAMRLGKTVRVGGMQ
jgi:hypothetical protein